MNLTSSLSLEKGIHFLRNNKKFDTLSYDIEVNFEEPKLLFSTTVNLKCNSYAVENTYFIFGKNYNLKKILFENESLSFHKIDLGLPAVVYWIYFPRNINYEETIKLKFIYETENKQKMFLASIYDFFYPVHYLRNFYSVNLKFIVPKNKVVITNCEKIYIDEIAHHKIYYFRGANKVVLTFAIGDFEEQVYKKNNYKIHLICLKNSCLTSELVQNILSYITLVLNYYQNIFVPTEKEIFILFLENKDFSGAFCARPLVIFEGKFSQLKNNYQQYLLAHELAHFYWGNGLAPYLDKGFWMVESLAEFSALLYLEDNFPPEDFSNFVWKNEIQPYTNYLANNADLPLNKVYPFFSPSEILYNKGALIFRSLSYFIGKNNLIAGFKKILQNENYTFVKIDEFKKILQNETKENLNYFFKYFFESANNFDLELKQVEEKKQNNKYLYHIQLEISGNNYPTKEVEILFSNLKEKKLIKVNLEKQNLTFVQTFNFKADKIIIDPNYYIVETNKKNNQWESLN